VALIDRQRAGREIGRIRMGTTVPKVSSKGNEFDMPVKLETWRLTSRSEHLIRAAAALFGGEVLHNDKVGWDVITPATELPVLIPPIDEIISEAFELWQGRECKRRCDGVTLTAVVGGEKKVGPCVCPADIVERMELAKDGRACKPTTRLNLIIPDLPDLGVWRLEVHAYDANAELSEMSDMLRKVRDAGVMMAARLWMDKRSVVRNGKTHEWMCPMLSVSATLRQLSAGDADLAAVMPPVPQTAITVGTPPPADDELAARRAQAWIAEDAVADQDPAWALARRAADGTRDVVAACISRSRDGGHDNDLVEIDGALEPLGEYLRARLEAFDARQ
jgi:hypothetical protein